MKGFRWLLTRILLVLLAVLFPLGLLLTHTRTGFTSDWYNNLWMGGHMGYFFKAHGSFPFVFNTHETVGVAFPFFYGHMLYPLLGVMGSLLKPNWGLRTACILLYLLQFLTVYRAAFVTSASRASAWVIAILTVWAIYPLSNLYARSAISEFAAVSLLFSTLSCWILFVKAQGARSRWTHGFYFAFLLSLMFGVHPITAYYGSICTGFLWLGSVYVYRPSRQELKWYVGALAGAGLLLLVTSAPWLDAFLTFGKHLGIAQQLGRNAYIGGVDLFWVRILPVPMDLRSLTGGISTPTTYLDAQVSLPLFALLIWCLWDRTSHLTWLQRLSSRAVQVASAFAAIAFFILLVSVTPNLEQHFVAIFKNFQIAYRMANYFNLFLLMSIFLVLHLKSGSDSIQRKGLLRAATFSAVVAIAFSGVVTKLLHGSVVWAEAVKYDYDPMANNEAPHFVTVPKSFYSLASYAVYPGLKALDPKELAPGSVIRFPVSVQPRFGEAGPVDLRQEAGKWIRTNVYPFAWNEILENGVPIPKDRLGVISEALPQLAVFVKESGNFRYAFETRPTPRWLFFRGVGGVVFWMSLVAALVLLLRDTGLLCLRVLQSGRGR